MSPNTCTKQKLENEQPAVIGTTNDALLAVTRQLFEASTSSAKHHHLRSAEHYLRAALRSLELAHKE